MTRRAAAGFAAPLLFLVPLVPCRASPERPRDRRPCPPVVADEATGVFRSTAGRGGGSYRCFAGPAAARRAGYSDRRAAAALPITGWWRLPLRVSVDTCGDTARSAAPVTAFLQLRESGGAVFGEVCPQPDRFVGVRVDAGTTLSAARRVGSDPLCGGGAAEVTLVLVLEKLGGSPARARYRRVRRCVARPDDPSPTVACVTEWGGTAFRETSHVFPAVPEATDAFPTTCAVTTTTCLGCHGG